MPRLIMSAAACIAAVSTLSAQNIAYGSSVISVISNVAPSEGLWIADRAGNCTAVTGIVAAGSPGSGINAVRMDPIDDRIWIGGINSNGNTAGQINYVRLNATATAVSQWVQHATTGGASSVACIEFDDNANPIVGSGSGLFRVDRKNGGVATPLTPAPGGTNNGITKDPSGNLYVGVFTGAGVYLLPKNFDGSYGAPVLLGSSPVTSISAVAHVAGAPDEIWISTFGAAGNMLFRMPATGGIPVAIANAIPASNWVEYDKRADDVLVLTNTGPDTVQVVDKVFGTATQLCLIQGGNVGVPSAQDANDDVDYVVRTAPSYLNGALGPFDLELGLTVPPSPTILAGVLELNTGIIIGVNFVGADGRFSVKLPNVTLGAPLPPGSLTFVGGSVDLITGSVTLGSFVPWPVN